MLSLDETIEVIAKKLDTEPPAPDANGDRLFELAEGMALGIRELPGGGCLAWAGVAEAGRDEKEAEAKATEFLRLRLARLRRHSGVVSAMDERGGLLLYRSLRSESAGELLEQVAGLLNETEAMRRILSGGAATQRAGGAGLFSGMADFFHRP